MPTQRQQIKQFLSWKGEATHVGGYNLLNPGKNQLSGSLRGKPDSHPIQLDGLRAEDVAQAPNVLFFPDGNQLGQFARKLDSRYRTGTGIQDIAVHEAQHGYAAKVQDADRVGFVVYRRLNAAGERIIQMAETADIRTTKLGRAAILAHPDEPSPNDLDGLQAMGYEDVHEVGSRITEHNQRGQGLYIPVPRAYAPSTQEVIDLTQSHRG
jgi:hypothetical protein